MHQYGHDLFAVCVILLFDLLISIWTEDPASLPRPSDLGKRVLRSPSGQALNSRPEVTGFWDGQASGEMCYTLSKDPQGQLGVVFLFVGRENLKLPQNARAEALKEFCGRPGKA